MRRGDQMRDSRVPTMENRISEIESGKIRMPVWSASSPSVICRYTGTMKNRPAVTAYWAPRTLNPLRSWRIENRLTCTSGGRPVSTSRRCRARNAHRRTPPRRMSHAVREMPSGAMGTPLISGDASGVIQPQVLLCSIPSTTKTSPAAERSTLHTSMRSGRGAVVSAIVRAKSTTIAMITTSATKT